MNFTIDSLKKWYLQHPKLVVAFSGGADSCLAVYLGRQFLGKENVLAVISTSPSLKRKDLDLARKFAETYDIQLHELVTNEMDDPNYLSNPTNRCYFCKNALYNHLHDLVEKRYPGFEIINGSNFDDLGDYRPGLEAAKEKQVLSPFVDCKVSKEEIRAMSKQFDLFSWDKPASPCLSSRFPYGEHITNEKLQQVERAENFVNDLGIKDVRVRHYGKKAKVEVPVEDLATLKLHRSALNKQLKNLGFEGLEIDEEGLVSGKMNRVLQTKD